MLGSVFSVAVLATALMASGCGGARAVSHRRPERAPNSTVAPGECADPARDGVVGTAPRIRRADLDLDGDGIDEWVATDRGLCSADGNCSWNLFSGLAPGGCRRYLGTVAARGLELLTQGGDSGYRDLRGWWSFGGQRYLLQHYSYRAGSYQLVDALVCQQQGDDRLLCAEDAH